MEKMEEITAELKTDRISTGQEMRLVRQADVEDLFVLEAQISTDDRFANGVRFGIDLALRILRMESVR